MLDYQRILDLYTDKISPESLLSEPNLSFEDKVVINLINQGKKAGLTIKEIKEWFINIIGSPASDKSDEEIIGMLEKLMDDVVQ